MRARSGAMAANGIAAAMSVTATARGRIWIEGRSIHVIHSDRGPVTSVSVEVAVETIAGIERCAVVGVGPRGCAQVVVVVEAPERKAGLAAVAIARRVRDVVDSTLGTRIAAVLSVPLLPVDIRHNTKIDRTLWRDGPQVCCHGTNMRRPW